MSGDRLDDEKDHWLDSHALAERLIGHRNNDVRVDVGGILVPVEKVGYDRAADVIVIHLYRGSDWRIAWMGRGDE